MPGMNEIRIRHASVAVGDTVYVVCGYQGYGRYLNSLERLDTTQIDSDVARWLLIRVPDSDLPPRAELVAAAINDNQIVILGGTTEKENDFSDVAIFDEAQTSIVERKKLKGQQQLRSFSNNSHAIRGDVYFVSLRSLQCTTIRKFSLTHTRLEILLRTK